MEFLIAISRQVQFNSSTSDVTGKTNASIFLYHRMTVDENASIRRGLMELNDVHHRSIIKGAEPRRSSVSSRAARSLLFGEEKKRGHRRKKHPLRFRVTIRCMVLVWLFKNPLRIMSTPARRRLMRDFKRYRSLWPQFFLPVLGS